MKLLALLLALILYSEHARRLEAEEAVRRRDLIELVERLERGEG